MKTISFIILLATIYLFGAAEFKIVSFEKDLNDKSAINKDTKLIDVNGNVCALVKVQTDLKDLTFESKLLEKFKYAKEGEYWVYLPKRTKRLKFKKEGVMPFTYTFPNKLEESTVYILKLTAEGLKKKVEDLAINVIIKPPNAKIYLDGIDKGEQSKIMISVGKHKIKIEKENYQTIQEDIEVSATNTYFNYTLEKVQDALVEINSNPSGAIVFIEGVKVGETPISFFHPVGSYNIKLESEDYGYMEDIIQIKSPETKKSYELKKDYEFKKKVKISKYKVQSVIPKKSKGELQITVIPSEAKIELSNDQGVKFISMNSKLFTNLPIGNYILSVKAKGYISYIGDFTMGTKTKIKKSITLQKGSDIIDLIFVKGGTFKMGSNEGFDNEKPVHSVTLNDFYIGKYEVVQKQYLEVMRYDPSRFNGENLPVESISWYDAVEFCNKLSIAEGLEECYKIDRSRKDPDNKNKYENDKFKYIVTCDFKVNGYRLPTEAEWEYVARGGSKSKGYKYSGSNDIDDVAWYDKNSSHKGHHNVGSKKPNELGVYDMSGNIKEWCWDWYNRDYYKNSPKINPTGVNSGLVRVVRGGSWGKKSSDCLPADRIRSIPSGYGNLLGFRVVRRP